MMNVLSKSYNKFLLLWLGELISSIGSGLTSFGLGVYVFQQTGKASAAALVTFLAFIPSFLMSVPAGVLADRYDRRTLMILSDSLSAVGLVYILNSMLQGEVQLWQICIGITISSIFSSMLEPAYKATVTDLLTKDQYTKASGLVQIANSSKFLISPILAGLLLAFSDIKLLLIIDISTFIITVISTLVVKRGLVSKDSEQGKSFIHDFMEGWNAVSKNTGVFILVIMGSLITFSLGFIEVLAVPMLLTFTSSSVAGTLETVVAMGILVSSIVIGILPIKGSYVKILSVSMFFEGIFMAGFGFRENIIIITISGFLFFAMMPYANASLDYLIRSNIDNSVQGRAWALIGVISQLGTVIAFACAGVISDYIFKPLLVEGGVLSGSVGKVIGTGNGRGTGFLIIIAGLLLCVTSVVLYNIKSIRKLENRGNGYVFQSDME